MNDLDTVTKLTITPEQLYDMIVTMNAKLDSLLEFKSEVLEGLQEFKHHPMLKALSGILSRG